MTLAELRTLARTEIGDTAAPYFFTDDQIDAYLNEAENEACIRGFLLQDSQTAAVCNISVVSGTAQYTLDSRVILGSVTTARLVTAGILLCVTSPEELNELYGNWQDNTGTPRAYFMQGGTINLYPEPDTTDTLNLTVYRTPLADMSADGDTPEINQIHHRNLIEWVKYQCFSAQDFDTYDPNAAQVAYSRFESQFGTRHSSRLLSGYHHVGRQQVISRSFG